MKKLAIIALATTVLTGAALAAAVAIPFWADGGVIAGFVGIKNTTSSDIEATIAYFDDAGDSQGGGTFLFPADVGWSFRPATADPGNEGDATAVPESSGVAGSALLTYPDPSTDIVARYVQVVTGGGQHAYLAPVI